MERNRQHNLSNPFQGDYKRVLCVCSAGLLRSPTAAHVLAQEPYNWNTRAVGCDAKYALNVLEEAHIVWADIILVMDVGMKHFIEDNYSVEYKRIVNLNIPDNYAYRDPELVELIKERVSLI